MNIAFKIAVSFALLTAISALYARGCARTRDFRGYNAALIVNGASVFLTVISALVGVWL